MANRYFRFTVNPLSPVRSSVDGRVELRLQFPQSGEVIWHRFADAEWFSVNDDTMGTFGTHLDYIADESGTPFFQEGVFEQVPDDVVALASLLSTEPTGPDNPPS